MAKFLVVDPGEFIAIDPKTGEEKFRAKTNIADANGEWANNFVKEIDRSIGKANEEGDVKDVKKYPINELHHLRYCLHTAAADGVRKHPAKEIEDLGLEILVFDGNPLVECDFALVRAKNFHRFRDISKTYPSIKTAKTQSKSGFLSLFWRKTNV